jgi:hypothetical protein
LKEKQKYERAQVEAMLALQESDAPADEAALINQFRHNASEQKAMRFFWEDLDVQMDEAFEEMTGRRVVGANGIFLCSFVLLTETLSIRLVATPC